MLHEHLFEITPGFGVRFRPVRAVPTPADQLACEPLHRHQPAGTDLGTIVAVDRHTTLGDWRRDWCCKRCISELTATHPEAVVWVPSTREGIADAPMAPGEPAQWPAEALGEVA